MKRAYVTPIVLLVVFVGLLAVLLVRDAVAPTESKEDGVVEVLAVPAEEVTSVVFQYDDTTVQVVRENDTWMLKQPFEAEARSEKMQDLLDEFVLVESTGEPLENPGELADYGLVDPLLVVTINTGDATRTLSFGERDFTGSSVYGMVNDDRRVHLLPGKLFATMQVDPEGLRKDDNLEE
ncbi:MAG: DUF4340 domain-containing protein [Candidatus Doudnabacteria bacterium]|nr:DUF4340 domain-containing protein [Candidatus Doudnabacteria bacterium]MCA9387557.1 DUF4340 domain-containing protein [Candidatus Andersenbacteria bacterium]